MASIACVDLLEARKYQQFTVHYKCEFMEGVAWPGICMAVGFSALAAAPGLVAFRCL